MRTRSSAHRLVVAYALLWAPLDLVPLLPGSNFSFSSIWGFVGSVFIQILLVWRLSRGSAVAWGFGLFIALGSFVWIGLQEPAIGASLILFVVVCLAQAGVLLAPPLRVVRSHRHTPPAAA